MTPRFYSFIHDFIFPHECAYEKGHEGDINHVTWEEVKSDPGGLTKWGIDQRSHPSLDIKALTKEEAEAIYWHKYWEPLNADALPFGWGEIVVDMKINGGDGARTAQESANEILIRERQEPLKVDGILGPKSIEGMKRAGNAGMRRMLVRRDARYKTLAADPRFAKFLAGWLNRDEDLREYLGLI